MRLSLIGLCLEIGVSSQSFPDSHTGSPSRKMRAVLLVVASAALAASQCTKNFPNASFNLSPLRKASGA
jgi:hypothetical protein